MVGHAGKSGQPVSLPIGVRRRIFVCLLAGLLGLTFRGFPELQGGQESVTRSDITINGTRYLLQCRGRGDATVVVVDLEAIGTILDQSARDELMRLVHFCVLTDFTDFTRGTQHANPDLAAVLPGLLIGAREPAPFVIVSEASVSPVLTWSAGPTAQEAAGFVLIDPAPPATGLVVQADGSNRPLPMDDRGQLVLAILSLFWPPEEV